MSLDATARESNLRDSVKKYFIDTFFTAGGYKLTFDKGLAIPKIQGNEVDRWIAVQFGPIDMDTVSEFSVEIYCCTRQDPEGYRLAHLRDAIVDGLIDSDQTDGRKRIVFYQSNTNPWTAIGALIPILRPESGQMTASDGTKFKVIPVDFKWGAKI